MNFYIILLRFQNLMCHIYITPQIQIIHISSAPQPYVASSNHTEQHRARGTNKWKEENKGNERKERRGGQPSMATSR